MSEDRATREAARKAVNIERLRGELAGRMQTAAERKRVAQLLTNDRIDRARETRRCEARLAVDSGEYAALDDATSMPTPEQVDKGEFRMVVTGKAGTTVRPVRAARRVNTSRVAKLNRAGLLDDDLFRACLWYQKIAEDSGLLGGLRAHGNFIGTIGGGDVAFGYLASTDHQLLARDFYHGARKAIGPDFLPMFEAVVLDEIGLKAASQRHRCRYANAVATFRAGALRLFDFACPYLPIRRGGEKIV